MDAACEQVLRFAVGEPGRQSGSWRLWVPPNSSDVYLSRRNLGARVKVSLHESGSYRFALDREYLRRPDKRLILPGGGRVINEWRRPAPQPGTAPFTHVFSIIVPWFEVIERPRDRGEITWIDAPPEESCVEIGLVYAPVADEIVNWPGRRSMGTELVGIVQLANGERCFVVSHAIPYEGAQRDQAEIFRRGRAVDAEGVELQNVAVLGFGRSDDGAAFFIDVAMTGEGGPDGN